MRRPIKPIKLSELIDALEFDSEEHVTKIDLQDGCVVTVDDYLLRRVEEGDEEALGHSPEWQQPELEIARAIVADSGERFLDAPEKFDFHEYRQMERFIGKIKDSDVAEQLGKKGVRSEYCYNLRDTPMSAVACPIASPQRETENHNTRI